MIHRNFATSTPPHFASVTSQNDVVLNDILALGGIVLWTYTKEGAQWTSAYV